MWILGMVFLLGSGSLLGDTLVLIDGKIVQGQCIFGRSARKVLPDGDPRPSIGSILFKTADGFELEYNIETVKELRLDGRNLHAVFGEEGAARRKAREEQQMLELVEEVNKMVAAQRAQQGASHLVGTWVYESQAYQTYEHVVLTLYPNGTYTRTLKLRAYGPFSGTGGGTDRGTWTATGNTVRVSGDGNLQPRTYNLANFSKVE